MKYSNRMIFSHVPAGINMMDPIYLEATDEWINSAKNL